MSQNANAPHVVCIWELGDNLGHLTQYLPIAKALQQQGIKVSFILRDLSKAESILGTLGCDVYQAPVWLLPMRKAPSPPVSYAEILLNYGYHNPDELAGLVKAWRAQIELLKPSLLMFDYAPTAQLATLGMGIPRTTIGGAFFIPPEKSPIPAFQQNHQISQTRLVDNEQKVLHVINQSAHYWGGKKLNVLYELFQADEHFLCTLPELDYYHAWRVLEPYYYGPLGQDLIGVKPQWLDYGEKRGFVYLRKNHPMTLPLLVTLQEYPVSILAYVPDIDEAVVKKFDATKIRFSKRPFQMDTMVGQCDFSIYHAGHGTLSYVTAKGKPSILLPQQVEQGILASLAKKMGVAKVVEPYFTKIQLKDLLTEAMGGEIFRKASEYEKQHPQFQPPNPLQIIIGRVVKLL